MNEMIFLIHIVAVVAFALVFLRMGKGALTVFIALQGILANLFVLKQMDLLGFSVTCSDVFAVGGILGLNLLQEYYGRPSAKEASYFSLMAMLFMALMSQVHLLYTPSQFDTTQEAFMLLFSPSLRIIIASVTTLFIVQQLDVKIFGLLKGRLPVRVATSLMISQFLDTTLFTFLGLYGLIESPLSVIACSFLIKCAVIGFSAPFVAFSKWVMRRVPI